jgi:site-specific recombinase XerD
VPKKLTKSVVKALQPRSAPFEERDKDLRGFLVRVEPGGTKSFFLDYRLAGGRKGKRTRYRLGAYPGLSVGGARALATRAAGEVASGIDLQARKVADRERESRERHSTLRAFLEGRYEPWARTHLRSVDFQLARLRSDFAEQLDQPLQAFNAFMVEGLRHRWKKGGLKARSINRDIQRLQSVLSRAVEWGVLDRHPLAGMKPLKTDKTARVRFLSADEESALRGALITRERRLREARMRFNAWRIARHKKPLPERRGDLLDHIRPLVILALNTGLRRGELLGLNWGSLNLPAKMLTVTAVTAKSGHTRRVPLNAEALTVLTSWRERQGKPAADCLVFPGPEGERMHSISTAWRSLIKTAGIKNFRLHDCRHHFASRLVQAGVDLYTVKELLGHSEIAMTEKYSHLAPDNLRAAVEKIAG